MRTFATTAAILLLTASIGTAQPAEGPSSVKFPAPVAPWNVTGSIGATVTVLPRPIAEEEIRHVPMLDVAGRVGLPASFSALAGGSTNLLTSSAFLGLQWSWQYQKYSIAVGDRQSFWYGTAPIEGFDASAYGWINHPFVTLGADYKEIRLLIRAEIMFVLYRVNRIGDHQIAAESGVNGGQSYTLAIEQPFLDDTDVLVGIRLTITNSAVQSWLAFSTLRDKLFFPEILFSVEL